MSDTPRTDAHSLDMESEDFDVELAKTYDFARQLERELNAAKAENAEILADVKKRMEAVPLLFLVRAFEDVYIQGGDINGGVVKLRARLIQAALSVTPNAADCGQSADSADILRTGPHAELKAAWDSGKRIRLAPSQGSHPWRRKGQDERPLVFEWSLPPSEYEIHPDDTAPDFGEPWHTESWCGLMLVANKHGARVCGDEMTLRGIQCVNACQGMPDPAADIQAMREAIREAVDKLNAICLQTFKQWKADGPLPDIALIEGAATGSLAKLKPFLP